MVLIFPHKTPLRYSEDTFHIGGKKHLSFNITFKAKYLYYFLFGFSLARCINKVLYVTRCILTVFLILLS